MRGMHKIYESGAISQGEKNGDEGADNGLGDLSFNRYIWTSPTTFRIPGDEKVPVTIPIKKPEDLAHKVANLRGLVTDDTRVVHEYCGISIPIGTMGEIKTDPKKYGFSSDLADIIAAYDAVEVQEEDILECEDAKPNNLEYLTDHMKTNRFDQASLYEKVLGDDKRLGLSIDRFKRRIGRNTSSPSFRNDFRYRRKETDRTSGKWVSSRYVHEALSALYEHDSLVEKNDADSQEQALEIASKYFTREAFQESKKSTVKNLCSILIGKDDWKSLKRAKSLAEKHLLGDDCLKLSRVIDFKLDSKSMELGEELRAAKSPGEYSLAAQVYSRLVVSKKPYNLGIAVDLAKRYLPRHVAERTKEMHKQAVLSTGSHQEADYLRPTAGTRETRSRRPTRELRVTQVPLPQPAEAYSAKTARRGPPPIPNRKKTRVMPPPVPQPGTVRIGPPPIPREAFTGVKTVRTLVPEVKKLPEGMPPIPEEALAA